MAAVVDEAYSFEILDEAVRAVITDERYQVSNEKAERCKLCSERLLEWMKENKAEASHMQRQIWENLNDCSLHHQNIRVTRQKLLRKYYKFVSSDEFADMWSQFLMKLIGFEACPIFYQFVTKLIMNNIIEKEFPIKSTDQLSSMSTIQYEDMNVIRYTSGYVLRSVLKKVNKSAQPFKEELMCCLKELIETEGNFVHNSFYLKTFLDHSDNQSHDESDDWIMKVDRGGLIHVDDSTYKMFLAVEMEVRKHLTVKNFRIGIKEKLLEEILKNEDVIFNWSNLAVNWGEESEELLKLIAGHWLTIRRYSQASAFINKKKMKHFKSQVVQEKN